MFAPYGEGRWTDRRAPEITGFSYVVSDDGRFALVEFVARDKRAFDGLMGSGRADVKVFRRGRARKEEVEQEFRKHKKDFDWERFWKHFGVVAR
jgi:hypothetical protein